MVVAVRRRVLRVGLVLLLAFVVLAALAEYGGGIVAVIAFLGAITWWQRRS